MFVAPPPRRLLVCATMLALLALVRTGRAQQDPPLTADRPGFGDAAAVLAQMDLQVEIGYTYAEAGAARQHTFGPLLVRFGLGAGLEVRAHLNPYVFDPEAVYGRFSASGFGDGGVSAKAVLVSGTGRPFGRPAVAAVVGTTIPAGDEPFGTDLWAAEGKLALDLALSASAAFSVNAGYGRTSAGFVAPSVGTALGRVPGLGVFAGYGGFNLFGETPDSGDGPRHFVEGGATYLVHPDLQVDLNGGLRVDGGGRDVFVGAGLVRRL